MLLGNCNVMWRWNCLPCVLSAGSLMMERPVVTSPEKQSTIEPDKILAKQNVVPR